MRHPSSRTPASAAYSEGEGGSRLVVVRCRRSLIRVLPPDLFPQDRACNLRERLPLETAGDRCEPLGSDGVWTKRGPSQAWRQVPGPIWSRIGGVEGSLGSLPSTGRNEATRRLQRSFAECDSPRVRGALAVLAARGACHEARLVAVHARPAPRHWVGGPSRLGCITTPKEHLAPHQP